MHHYHGFFLQENTGNNAFTYTQRLPDAQLRVPKLILWDLKDLKIWSHPVFSELNEQNQLQNYLGLHAFLKLKNTSVPIYIFDNHNHALYFWYLASWDHKKNHTLIHIDQHSDLKENPHILKGETLDEVFDFTNQKCNVGNFINPALNNGFLSQMIQIRTEGSLLNFNTTENDYILDIDLDFRAEEMSIENFDLTIKKTRNLIPSAKVVTIATSPYFLPQERAIQLLHLLLENQD